MAQAIPSREEFFKTAFSRNHPLVSQETQTALEKATVAIAGLGGVGGIYATTMARLGIGRFHIADLDTYEVANFNRQAGASVAAVGRSKVEVMKELILNINPYAEISTFPEGIHEKNIDTFLEGVDVVLDGIDFFSIETRRLLFQKAREHKTYTVTCGPVGYGAALHIFGPKGMSFDEYFDVSDSRTKTENLIRFGIGVTPGLLQTKYFKPTDINFRTYKAPSLATAVSICAGFVGTEVVRIIEGKRSVLQSPWYLHVDPYIRKMQIRNVWGGNKNPWQQFKIWYFTRMLQKKGLA